MMSATHIILSKQVIDHILLRYQIHLKKLSLIYGSIKPDASTLFAKYPHKIEKSLDMLEERIQMLIEATENINEIETRAFAREIGVALHYTADYFCRPHNEINKVKPVENFTHIIYEQKLQNKIKEYDLETQREEIVKDIDRQLTIIKRIGIKEYVKYKHRKYKKEAGKLFLYSNIKKRYEIDIKNALQINIIIATYIIEKIIKKGEKANG